MRAFVWRLFKENLTMFSFSAEVPITVVIHDKVAPAPGYILAILNAAASCALRYGKDVEAFAFEVKAADRATESRRKDAKSEKFLRFKLSAAPERRLRNPS